MGPPMSVGDRVVVDGMAGEIAFLGASFVPRSSHVPCASCPLRIYACVCVCESCPPYRAPCVCVCTYMYVCTYITLSHTGDDLPDMPAGRWVGVVYDEPVGTHSQKYSH